MFESLAVIIIILRSGCEIYWLMWWFIFISRNGKNEVIEATWPDVVALSSYDPTSDVTPPSFYNSCLYLNAPPKARTEKTALHRSTDSHLRHLNQQV